MHFLQSKRLLVIIGVVGAFGVIIVGVQLYRIWQLYTGLALHADMEVIVCETLHLPAIPIEGAEVTIVGAGVLRSGITEENGTVAWAGLPRGKYAAIVEKEGFLSFALPLGEEAPSISMLGNILGWTVFQVGAKSYQWTPPVGPYAYASADRPAVLVERGSSTNVTLTITPYNFFEGEVLLEIPRFEPYTNNPLPPELILELSTSSVTLKVTEKPSIIFTTLQSEITPQSSPSLVIINAAGYTAVTLTIAVGSNVSIDTYILSILVKGEFGALHRPLLLGVV